MPLIHHFLLTPPSLSSLSTFVFYLTQPPLFALVLTPTAPKLNVVFTNRTQQFLWYTLKVVKLNFTKYRENDCEIRQTGPKMVQAGYLTSQKCLALKARVLELSENNNPSAGTSLVGKISSYNHCGGNTVIHSKNFLGKDAYWLHFSD